MESNAGQPAQRIGELLVRKGLISREQLEHGLARQRMTREFLGAILVQIGAIQPDTLLAALSEQFKIPQERLRLDQVDWTIARQLPASALSGGRCFPIRGDAASITVALANPLDAGALSAIEQAAQFRTIKPVLVLEEELRSVLREHQARMLRHITERLNPDARRQ